MATASALSSAHARVRAGVAATRATARPPPGRPDRRATSDSWLPERRFARARHDPPRGRLIGRRDDGPVRAHRHERVDLDAFESFVVEPRRPSAPRSSASRPRRSRSGPTSCGTPATRPAVFREDAYARSGTGSGFGVTRVMENGGVFEKAAANVSVIRGTLSPERAAAMSARGRPGVDPSGGQTYAAAALSLVFHPRSPMVPTFRADVRRFTVDGVGSWYGGGADLTPYYLFDEDAVAFHAHYRNVCAAHGATAPSDINRSGALHAGARSGATSITSRARRAPRRGGVFFDDMSDDETGSANGRTTTRTTTRRRLGDAIDRSIVDASKLQKLP